MNLFTQRIFVGFSSLLVWFFGFYLFKPFAAKSISSVIPNDPGLKLLFNHAFVYSLPTALICGAWWFFLIKKGYLPRPQFKKNLHKVIMFSTTIGILGAAITLAIIPLLFDFQIKFHFNFFSVAGNLFSNTWEEVIYRGLLFTSFTFATGFPLAGAILSSIIFGFTHDQYPLGLQVYVVLVGLLLCWTNTKFKNFVAPIWVHNVLDWIADLFL